MQIPLEVIEALLGNVLSMSVWPFFRIAGVIMVAPVFGARLVSPRVRIALSVAVTAVISPLIPVDAAVRACRSRRASPCCKRF